MCIEVIGIVASLAGTVMGAVGQNQAAQAQAQAARYEQQVAANNAIIAQRMADDARKRGEVAENEERRKASALIGRQTAVMSANGLDITSASPLDILGDTGALGELEALTTRGNYEREALGHEATKMNQLAASDMAGMKAKSAATAGKISAFTTLASGIGSVADKWYNLKNPKKVG